MIVVGGVEKNLSHKSLEGCRKVGPVPGGASSENKSELQMKLMDAATTDCGEQAAVGVFQKCFC